MASKIQKWGNSLAIRIPKSYAESLKMNEGTDVKIKINKDRLVITKKRKQELKLDDLLKGINTQNLHKEFQLNKPTKKEASK